jgi:hypothetical protein
MASLPEGGYTNGDNALRLFWYRKIVRFSATRSPLIIAHAAPKRIVALAHIMHRR